MASRSSRFFLFLSVAAPLALTGCGAPPPLYAPRYHGPTPPYYYVRRGDTLYSIGRRFGVDHRKIARWNDIENPSSLELSQRLRLIPPDGQSGDGGGDTGGRRGRDGGGSGTDSQDVTTKEMPKVEKVAVQGQAEAGGPGGWLWPVSGRIIRSYDPEGRSRSNGIDIAAPSGAEVRAAAPGQVVYAGDGLRGYGNLVIIRHGGGFLTTYAYNRENLVAEDDTVDAGQPVARVGKTGAAKQHSLHFEVRRRTDPIDPLQVLPDR
ncbi:peptidoglycan DD-metalloendopeptidase family protein [Thiohalorhabdus methylotrophus]|uniref:Peptidoglycan DD-metalloendopeptidase family protein n=1 Tax=Thiohalorhabdus methylotrophus TaxID=3242694 RepID=A0ABV4TXE1_9GAMM